MAKDPYRYFRVEARELIEGLGQGVLALERGGGGDDPMPRLRRLAHTLKGAARVVKQAEIAELAHAAEDALEAAAVARTQQQIEALLGVIDAMSARVAALGPGAPETAEAAPLPAPRADDVRAAPPAENHDPPAAQAAVPAAVGALETVRVDVADLDLMLRGASEAAVQVGGARSEAARVERAIRLAATLVAECDRLAGARSGAASRDDAASDLARELLTSLEGLERGFAAAISRAEQEISGVRDAADKLRLLPARVVFDALDRAVRDAASATGHRASFEAVGGETSLEAHVLAAVRSALLHVVRNAVAHGGEPEAARLSAGKPAALRVRLEVARRGSRVVFACSDDGRGVDVDAVRSAAIRLGTLDAERAAALDEQGAVRLILGRGLTTRTAVSELSGRGIGLDVVRETALLVKGEVDVHSERGRGTRLDLVVPVSVSSLTALVVEAGAATVAIPLHAVACTISLGAAGVARASAGDAILHDGAAIPYREVADMLGDGDANTIAARENRAARAAVVLEVEGLRAAVGVDRLVGAKDVVMRPLPAVSRAPAMVAGASLDAQGNPQLVLDPAALVHAARAAIRRPPAPARPARWPVLVVDDSLTTRMLEQSILQSAGYEVATATSAEEALEIAQTRRFGLFLVDVEMPGMSGFDFVARTRDDAALRETPAILVTSRNSADDRARGARVGASAYIVKGEFDQVLLLETVRRLVG